MCVVSMITDHYRQQWPIFTPYVEPNFIITKEQWQEYLELKRKASEYDVRNNEPYCAKQGVSDWEAAVEAYLVNLEREKAQK